MDANRLNSKMYKFFDIWKRHSNDCAIKYRCFEVLGKSKFGVQNVDYLYLPIKEKLLIELDNQFLELFIEIPPDERTEVYSTVEEAINSENLVGLS